MLKLFGAIARRMREFKLTQELRSLDDHLLRDIGVERYQIDAVASGALRREGNGIAWNDNAKPDFRKAA